jgi:predicted acylesterase/phospholipase RssA
MFDPERSALLSGGGGTMGMFYEAGSMQGLEDRGIHVKDLGCYLGISAGAYNSVFLAGGDDAGELRRDIDELLVFLSNLGDKGFFERYYDRTRRVLELASDGVRGIFGRNGETSHDSFFSALIESRLKRIIGDSVGLDDFESDVFLVTWDCRYPTTRVVATNERNAERLEDGDPNTKFVYDKPIAEVLAGSSSFLWPSGYLKDGGFCDPCPIDLALRSGYDDTVFIVNPLTPIPGLVKGIMKNGEQNWRRGYCGRFNERLDTHKGNFPDSTIILVQPDITDDNDSCMRLFPMRMNYLEAYKCGYRNAIRALDEF